jgi:hypothetical protein
MVRHQAVRMHIAPMAFGQLAKMQQVQQVVVVAPKARCPVVAALHDVSGDAGHEVALLSRHGGETASPAPG